MKYIDSRTKNEKNVKIILETSAGQGTELLSNFDEFLMFMQKFKTDKRFGICLDTCHIFSAGIDIRDKKTFGNIISKCDDKIGLKKIELVHLNDSKHDLGERKDRHESLGYGFIGRDGLKDIIKKLKSKNIPIILETPSAYHENELKWIKKL
jgi:deoxyribonuclease-4